VQKGAPLSTSRQKPAGLPVATGSQAAEDFDRFNRVREDLDVAVMLDDRISALIPTERRQTH
jgi:hypothetical protein